MVTDQGEHALMISAIFGMFRFEVEEKEEGEEEAEEGDQETRR